MILAGAAQLAARNALRRCIVCGGEATVVCPGQEAEYSLRITSTRDGGKRRHNVLVVPEKPDLNLCLAHAAERWPWRSHKRRAAKAQVTR